MAQLKSRQRQIPGGFRFHHAETGWKSTSFASFDTVVREVIAHRQGNAKLRSRNLPTDFETVAAEVDAYNAKICEVSGWGDYITSGGPTLPKSRPRLNSPLQSARNVVAGGETLKDWLGSGAVAVPPEQSSSRAAICARCPVNQKGDLLSLFTIPVANRIQKAIEEKNRRKLSTPYDEALGVCEACECPLKLMVHSPIEEKLKHMTPDAFGKLWAECWIRKETAK